MIIYGTKDFMRDFKNLFEINFNEDNGENSVIKYCYLTIYGVEFNQIDSSSNGDENGNGNEEDEI